MNKFKFKFKHLITVMMLFAFGVCAANAQQINSTRLLKDYNFDSIKTPDDVREFLQIYKYHYPDADIDIDGMVKFLQSAGDRINYDIIKKMMKSTADPDGFVHWWGFEEKVTTELIPCISDSNSYTRVNIHRKYGIPQFGIVTNCNGQTLDTVWYPFLKNANIYEGMIIAPVETDTSITVWLENKSDTTLDSFSIIIMDVLTGNIYSFSIFQGIHSNCFENTWPNPLYLSNSEGGTITNTISFIPGKAPKNIKDEYLNEGHTFNYSNIPNGLYFLSVIKYYYDYITYNNKFVVPYMRTIAKGIERREIIEE